MLRWHRFDPEAYDVKVRLAGAPCPFPTGSPTIVWPAMGWPMVMPDGSTVYTSPEPRVQRVEYDRTGRLTWFPGKFRLDVVGWWAHWPNNPGENPEDEWLAFDADFYDDAERDAKRTPPFALHEPVVICAPNGFTSLVKKRKYKTPPALSLKRVEYNRVGCLAWFPGQYDLCEVSHYKRAEPPTR